MLTVTTLVALTVVVAAVDVDVVNDVVVANFVEVEVVRTVLVTLGVVTKQEQADDIRLFGVERSSGAKVRITIFEKGRGNSVPAGFST